MRSKATNPYVDHLERQARFVAAAAAYCARHETIAAIAHEVKAVPCLRTTPADVRECIEHLKHDATYDEPAHQRMWWEYKTHEIRERDEQLCIACIERVRLWSVRRELRAGGGGLKRALLRAYRGAQGRPFPAASGGAE